MKFLCGNFPKGKEITTVLPEIIIHGGIKHVSVQPGLRALPYLPYHNTLRIFLMSSPMEISPKSPIHFICHIQTPAIHLKFPNPITAYFHKISSFLRIRRIQLRHLPLISETTVCRLFFFRCRAYHRKLQLIKPVGIFGAFSFFHHIAKLREIPAAMVEHTINDNVHSSVVNILHQFPELFVRSHIGGHMKIV